MVDFAPRSLPSLVMFLLLLLPLLLLATRKLDTPTPLPYWWLRLGAARLRRRVCPRTGPSEGVSE